MAAPDFEPLASAALDVLLPHSLMLPRAALVLLSRPGDGAARRADPPGRASGARRRRARLLQAGAGADRRDTQRHPQRPDRQPRLQDRSEAQFRRAGSIARSPRRSSPRRSATTTSRASTRSRAWSTAVSTGRTRWSAKTPSWAWLTNQFEKMPLFRSVGARSQRRVLRPRAGAQHAAQHVFCLAVAG